VAGPVSGDRVELTNVAWEFSIEATKRALGFERLIVVNDLVAHGWAVPTLRPDEIEMLQEGAPDVGAPSVVVAVGTGLGVATVVPWPGRDGKASREGEMEGTSAAATRVPGREAERLFPSMEVSVLSSEGGHSDLAASSEREWRVVERLRARFGDHVSAERVISGSGLPNLWRALAEIDEGAAIDREVPDGAAIAARSRDGEARARETTALFSSWLGAFCGDLALTVGARGGVYLAGGVLAGMGSAFDVEGFLARFAAKGRFHDWLAAVPVRRVRLDEMALAGLANLVAGAG